MSDDPLVGRSYPAVGPYRVSREKIREFADAVNDPHPAYREVEAARALGYRDVVAPPTFPIIFCMDAAGAVLLDPDTGIDLARMVHGDQHFRHHRPLVAGDELTTSATVDAVREAGGNRLVTIRSEAVDAAGEAVVTATMLVVSRGQADS